MAKFQWGNHVRFKTVSGETLVGVVSYQSGKTYHVVDFNNRHFSTSTSAKKQKRVIAGSMKRVPFGLFVFDTRLDSAAATATLRRAEAFWREFCFAAQWQFHYERVHSMADLHYFLEKTVIAEPVILFNGHGNEKTGWELSNSDVLDGQREAHRRLLVPHKSNVGKTVIFSACDIGRNKDLCERLRRMLRAKCVIAYNDTIQDDLCYLAEAQLIHLLNYQMPPKKAVEVVRLNMDFWKTKVRSGKKTFPLVYVP
jgi:hypothetical protein